MELDYVKLCDIRYDELFERVDLLERYPWVGEKYKDSKFRVLILGDSHYTIDREKKFCEEEFKRCKTNKDYTREIIRCVINDVCEGEPTWTMYKNLVNTFTSYTPEEVKYLWSKVAFYNFIQEPMKQINQVPTNEDCKIGWKCFYDVVNILKPHLCLFIGIRSNREIDTIRMLGGNYTLFNDSKKCNRSVPLYGEIKTKEYTTKFRIIRHTSRFYSPEAWNQYLMDKEREMMCQLDLNFQ